LPFQAVERRRSAARADTRRSLGLAARVGCSALIDALSIDIIAYLATSGFGHIGGAAFGLLKQIIRPLPPALRHPGNRK
jgi:hypothetical protein